jgi:hypothetical protein
MNKTFFITVIGCSMLFGCTGSSQNAELHSQVDALQKREVQLNADIAHLQSQLQDQAKEVSLKDQAIAAAQKAWNWTKSEAEAAWNSDLSTEARTRMEKCYYDLKGATTDK